MDEPSEHPEDPLDRLADAVDRHLHEHLGSGEPPAPASPSAALQLRPGSMLADFELVRELGRGGMGVVWLAKERSLGGRLVALKLLPEAARFSASRRARFQREAKVAGRLSHPHLLTVHAFTEHHGTPILVLEYVEGGRTLHDWVVEQREQAPSSARYRQIAELFTQVADGMAAAHAAGILHRDLKPGNILLDPAGRPKVGDFGLAQDREEVALSDASESPGTPAYKSPEQVRAGKQAIDERSDVWSLGVALYETLALARPFDGDTPEQVQAAIRDLEPVDPRRVRRGIPRDLAVIAGHCLEKDPSRRYASMAELADDLRRYLEGRPLRARPPGHLRRSWSWMRRHPAIAAAATLLLTALPVFSSLTVALAASNRERERYLRLADWRRLQDLQRQAEALWPARIAVAPGLELWLTAAHRIHARLPIHQQACSDLERSADRQAGTWLFADEGLAWQHDVETEILARLQRLADDAEDPNAIPAVTRRLELVLRIPVASLVHAEPAWQAAIAAIADPQRSPAYGGLRLSPQLGLVPVGPDPVSGLWEFAHVATGDVPTRDAEGQLQITAETGIVLVLLPGGTFDMGAETQGPNADPWALPKEAPGGPVTLAPFFLAKHETTQAQWRRLTCQNPSYYSFSSGRWTDMVTAVHPVERVSWDDGRTWLHRVELTLPTEAQWEYAARAGTSSPWWTGTTIATLAGAANVADRRARRDFRGQLPEWTDEFDDGYTAHAPVGRYRANPLGLHDVIGNVWEWCADDEAEYTHPVAPGTGLRLATNDKKIFRGGAFDRAPVYARHAHRMSAPAATVGTNLGVRAARAITPDPPPK